MEKSNSHLPLSDEEIVETLHRALSAGEQHEAASLLRKSRIRFEETGYDNWKGGTYRVTLYVQAAPETFTLLGERRAEVERQFSEMLRSAVSHLITDSFDANIAPLIVGMRGRPDIQGNPIPKRVRGSLHVNQSNGKKSATTSSSKCLSGDDGWQDDANGAIAHLSGPIQGDQDRLD